MADQLVDTNVLIVASAAEGLDPRYEDVSVGPEEIERVHQWLVAFRDDHERCLVLDETLRIYRDEYLNKLTGEHFGLQVIHYKMSECCRFETVEYDEHNHGIVPEALAPVDNSDKKFVAAALNDPDNIHIVNACDSDWAEQKALLDAHGVTVIELLR